jgi:hypothetical protein
MILKTARRTSVFRAPTVRRLYGLDVPSLARFGIEAAVASEGTARSVSSERIILSARG